MIDAVITWVDGADPRHFKKKNEWLLGAFEDNARSQSGLVNLRWENSDEILLCLSSLGAHASWIRKIWIVTDDQVPNLYGLDSKTQNKICIVDHKDIFRGYEEYLPTFNSLSIETALWRIPGLAEKYLYFNDDCFLSGELRPDDVFLDGKPVVRGKWVNLEARNLSMYRLNQVNAAQRLGFDKKYFFSNAHVAHAYQKNILEEYYQQHPDAFESNLSHKFREESQYSSISLMTHIGVRWNSVHIQEKKDWQNISVSICNSEDKDLIEQKLRILLSKKTKFGCINDIISASATYPDTRSVINRAISGK